MKEWNDRSWMNREKEESVLRRGIDVIQDTEIGVYLRR